MRERKIFSVLQSTECWKGPGNEGNFFFFPKNNFHICALYRENEQTKSLRGEKVETK